MDNRSYGGSPPRSPTTGWPPLYAWIVTMDKELSRTDYNQCQRVLGHPDIHLKHRPTEEQWRILMEELVPYVIMRNRGIPSNQWYFFKRHNKLLIKSVGDKQIGFSISSDESVIAMAFGLGYKKDVANVGIDVRRAYVPPGVGMAAFVESQEHRLTPKEVKSVYAGGAPDDVITRRLFILLSLKASYIKALGQPLGFDLRRIECSITTQSISVDSVPLNGWEFFLFKAQLGRDGGDGLMREETYQCVSSIYRGGFEGCSWHWNQGPKELDAWLRFVPADQVINAAFRPEVDKNSGVSYTYGSPRFGEDPSAVGR